MRFPQESERVMAAPETLGLDTRVEIRKAAIRLLEEVPEGVGRMALDLTRTRPVDSAGLGALMLIRRRVLIVEDEPALRLSYERAFHPRYDLVFASTGAEALEQLEQHKPDVAVLDMRLPDTDGVDLLRRIRLSQPELPVIITTAYMSTEPQLEVPDLPHSSYIVKPFPLTELGTPTTAL